MSMHGVDFAFNFFQPKGEKNKGELEEAAQRFGELALAAAFLKIESSRVYLSCVSRSSVISLITRRYLLFYSM
ncbi:hypothetical protein PJ912_27705 [Pectobacterium colocasium]|uniref:hypothetical protein n=1 Tax=Pectobacterium TaxID=122277 RepID=UPI003D73951C